MSREGKRFSRKQWNRRSVYEHELRELEMNGNGKLYRRDRSLNDDWLYDDDSMHGDTTPQDDYLDDDILLDLDLEEEFDDEF